MNAAKAIEIAIAHTLRTHAAMGADTAMRPFQTLRWDTRWNLDDENSDRRTPCADIRCSPSIIVEGDLTYTTTVSVEFITTTEQDRDHARLSAIFEAGYQCLRQLLIDAATLPVPTSGPFATFTAKIAELDAAIAIAGFVNTQPTAPSSADGLNSIGLSFEVRHS